MNAGEARRVRLWRMIAGSARPMPGGELARALGVSRQVIVQDIALMRAENRGILSTNKGYICREAVADAQPKRVFRVRHTTQQVLDEFLTVLELGGCILDVSVEHELYGQIRVDLLIETQQDARDFADRLARCRDNPLKALTGDCHDHTVAAPSEKLLDLIGQALREKGMLVEEAGAR